MLSLSLFALLGLGLLPMQTQAQSESLTLTVQADGISSYETVVEQTEQGVRRLVSEAFNADPTLSEVYVVATVERNGSVLPLMSMQVSREEWQNDTLFAHAGYSRVARGLLNFESETQIASAPSPTRQGVSDRRRRPSARVPNQRRQTVPNQARPSASNQGRPSASNQGRPSASNQGRSSASNQGRPSTGVGPLPSFWENDGLPYVDD
ncbi:MAG: hypothetical protein AAGF01_12480 [Cyanobacteria bacterium P01_G01_bin.38]